MKVKIKIVSGGQTGADRAALDAAKYLGMKTGGYCPKGFLTETSKDEYLKKFKLIQTKTGNYSERTFLNVKNSDGTVVFMNKTKSTKTGIGSRLTIQTAKAFGKPYIINPSKSIFHNWLKTNKVKTLNFAGNRLSENNKIYSEVFTFLVSAFNDELSDKALVEFRESLHIISANLHSGSVALLEKITAAILKFLKKSKLNNRNKQNEIIHSLDIFNYGRFKEMQVIPGFVKDVCKFIKNNKRRNNSLRLLTEYINSYRKSISEESAKIIKEAITSIDFYGKKVMLISNSRTIIHLFKALHHNKRNLKIFQCHSLPGGEGKLQAEKLRSFGYDVNLIKDSNIRKYAAIADFAVLGCDAFNGKYFVNKRGSFEIAGAFKVLNKDVYVLAGKYKYIRKISHVKSGLFEMVPISFVTYLFS